jgi:hypothetical protein
MQIRMYKFLILNTRRAHAARVIFSAIFTTDVLSVSKSQSEFACTLGTAKKLRMRNPPFLYRRDKQLFYSILAIYIFKQHPKIKTFNLN